MRASYFVGDFISLGIGCVEAIDVEICLLSLTQRYECSSIVPGVVLTGTNDFVLGVIHELVPVCKPPGQSGNHEENWEHISWESHSLINDATVEVNIGIELPLDKILITQSNPFQFHSNLYKFLLTGDLENILCNTLDNFSSGIIAFIDTMTEPIQQFLPILNILNKLRNIFLLANLLEHPKHSLIGPTMFGSI